MGQAGSCTRPPWVPTHSLAAHYALAAGLSSKGVPASHCGTTSEATPTWRMRRCLLQSARVAVLPCKPACTGPLATTGGQAILTMTDTLATDRDFQEGMHSTSSHLGHPGRPLDVNSWASVEWAGPSAQVICDGPGQEGFVQHLGRPPALTTQSSDGCLPQARIDSTEAVLMQYPKNKPDHAPTCPSQDTSVLPSPAVNTLPSTSFQQGDPMATPGDPDPSQALVSPCLHGHSDHAAFDLAPCRSAAYSVTLGEFPQTSRLWDCRKKFQNETLSYNLWWMN